MNGSSQSLLALLATVCLAIALSATMIALSLVLGRKGKNTPTKNQPYECGITPAPLPNRLTVQYYTFGALFLVFESLFVYIFALASTLTYMTSRHKLIGLVAMCSLLIPITVSLIFGWRNGMLANITRHTGEKSDPGQ